MANKKSPKELIIDVLKEKACLKQSVFRKTIDVFGEFKKEAEQLAEELKEEMCKVDDQVVLEFTDKGDYEFHIKFGGDILVFYMHTNVFEFPKSHQIWNNSYLKDHPLNSYCGMINVYNFLSDSFKYNRINDTGYLVARCFINNEKHFFIEGKRQLGFLYNNFASETINNKKIRSILESTILYSMDFDLLTPPYDTMKEVSVMDIFEVTNAVKIKTAKRLGFKFQADSDNIE
ncbi:MAG: hypothetical protein H6587_08840 [Flavobacteriales bacterium]|nr:hypothetical protein [Flavobacteriales bacterium]MCB9364661.1 hypothetical protein [Flavobacteriales bacterium]